LHPAKQRLQMDLARAASALAMKTSAACRRLRPAAGLRYIKVTAADEAANDRLNNTLQTPIEQKTPAPSGKAATPRKRCGPERNP
jgi:hypothetical protein